MIIIKSYHPVTGKNNCLVYFLDKMFKVFFSFRLDLDENDENENDENLSTFIYYVQDL